MNTKQVCFTPSSMPQKLSSSMSLKDFDNGYWYATDIKAFAKEIGVSSVVKLRKDELEVIIRHYLMTGEIKSPARRKLRKDGVPDYQQGLRLDLPIVHYTSNSITKAFLFEEAKKIDPDFKLRSGARYRLNRWREAQIEAGKNITYGDLLAEYMRLNRQQGEFEKIPSGRYINFLSEFTENHGEASRDDALSAWHALKDIDAPKTYAAWKRHFKP